MAILMGLNNEPNKVLRYGGQDDVCQLCLKEKCEMDKISYQEAELALRGQLKDKKVLKLRKSGTEYILCLNHLAGLAKEAAAENEETENL